MSLQTSLQHLNEFLSSPDRAQDCYSLHQLLGAYVALLSSPVYVSETELIMEALAEFDTFQDFDFWYNDEALHRAWMELVNTLTDELALDKFDLSKYCEQDVTAIEPSSEFRLWCDGYLRGYMLTEEIWQEVHQNMKEQELAFVVEEHESLLNLLATVADWEQALADSSVPEKLQDNIEIVFNAINDGVLQTHKLVMMLEDIGYIQPDEPVHSVKTGRNEPCPCGSGKKYKKCCLH